MNESPNRTGTGPTPLVPLYPDLPYHWLRIEGGDRSCIWQWNSSRGMWLDDRGDWNTASSLAFNEWRYVAPAYPPEDVRNRFHMVLKLQEERDELRKLLADLGAGIPAAAILKAEDRT